MSRVAVFGGTTEGRVLARRLTEVGADVSVFVATSYGKDIIPPHTSITIKNGRLNSGDMLDIFKSGNFDYVVDCTHPYAAEATANLLIATVEADIPYLRVSRESAYHDAIHAENAEAAMQHLNQMTGNILLTTGSNTLHVFTEIENWQNRLFARVLPDADSLQNCTELGLTGRNLICMQGPFTHEMNVATIKMYGIAIMVTKDSGAMGGFPEKLSAARECGTKLIVIGRPKERGKGECVDLETAMDILTDRLELQSPIPARIPHFPLFIPLEGKAVLIIGGGKVAARRARVLLEFGASVTVAAPEICAGLREIAGHITWKPELYSGINKGFILVIAATDDRNVNKKVGEDAKAVGIPVSVADCKEESTFWFPGIARSSGIVAGLTSEDGNHGAVKRAVSVFRKVLRDGI